MARFARLSAPAIAALAACGCGYVGDPHPPALDIAAPVQNLRVVQYGDKLVLDFTAPALTTEGLPVRSPGQIEVRIGATPPPFNRDRWASTAQAINLPAPEPGASVEREIPAAPFRGKDVAIGVRIFNSRGRLSDFSNIVSIVVSDPLPKPVLKASPAPQGVRLQWTGAAPSWRVYRQGPNQDRPEFLAETQKPEYVDPTAQLGQEYRYLVQGRRDKAESEISDPAAIVPKDEFPPAVPTGLTATASVSTIELAWNRNTEPDLRGYKVYRAVGDGAFERIAELVETPTYSDRQIETGKRYRYAVTAFDTTGNESARSAIAEATAP